MHGGKSPTHVLRPPVVAAGLREQYARSSFTLETFWRQFGERPTVITIAWNVGQRFRPDGITTTMETRYDGGGGDFGRGVSGRDICFRNTDVSGEGSVEILPFQGPAELDSAAATFTGQRRG